MLTVKIHAPENVDLFRDGRYVLAACQIGRHPECQVRGIAIEHGNPSGFDHQVSIGVDAKYEGTGRFIGDTIRRNCGEMVTLAFVGGE
jgi:hypothetical protein